MFAPFFAISCFTNLSDKYMLPGALSRLNNKLKLELQNLDKA